MLRTSLFGGRIYGRGLQAVAACLLAMVMLGADSPANSERRFERMGHNMICTCGCGQILLECNHVGCPVSGPMIGELRSQMSAGQSEKAILDWFAMKYGAVVLASPSRGGFDRVAWIVPFSVMLLATLGTAVIVRLWARRRGGQVALGQHRAGTLEHSTVRDRIRRETEY